MGRTAVVIELTATERRGLESLARAHRTGQAMARRARIVLDSAEGPENRATGAAVGADANTVSKWRRRCAAHRLDGLLDEPRPGAPRKIGHDTIAETIRLTLETTPPGATHNTKPVRDGLAKRPRWHVHFTPPGPPGSTRSSGSSPS